MLCGADCAAAGAIPARGSSAPPLITAEAARTHKWDLGMDLGGP